MKSLNTIFLLSGVALALSSCAGIEKFTPKPKIENPNEGNGSGLSDAELKNINSGSFGGAAGAGEIALSGNDIQAIHKDLEWAPEDPNVEFQTGLAEVKKYETWTKSYKKAIRESRETGKPLLIWFSNSKTSTISKKLSSELFSRVDFQTWVRDNYATLLVDKAIDESVYDKKTEYRLKKYYEMMKERFSVHGTPEVLVVDAKGNVQARYRGYTSGDAEHYWGRLKIAKEVAQKQYGAWREKMEAKGFRMWHSVDGKKVFAKLIHAEVETLTLVTPNNKRSKVSVNRLSQNDRDYVAKKASL